jgi:hypothetical protein
METFSFETLLDALEEQIKKYSPENKEVFLLLNAIRKEYASPDRGLESHRLSTYIEYLEDALDTALFWKK